jgi:hypothetical protein
VRTPPVAVILAIALMLGLPPKAVRASFVSMAFGLDVGSEYPCPLRVVTAQWAASDYPTFIVVQWGATRAGDRRETKRAQARRRGYVDDGCVAQVQFGLRSRPGHDSGNMAGKVASHSLAQWPASRRRSV